MSTETSTEALSLTEVPDYYSTEYRYHRFPAKVGSRAGSFKVWSRSGERVNPQHVTWSPETAVLVAKEYQNAAWHAERAERAARPQLDVGDHVRLGHLVIEVPRRAAEYVDGVPCPVVEDHRVEEISTAAYVAAVIAVNDSQLTTAEAREALARAIELLTTLQSIGA